jgi:NodT family efflux transporter outer membrane factor (OMF) lipoprotein
MSTGCARDAAGVRLDVLVLLGVGLLLSACAVGPDFERPKPPTAQRYDTESAAVTPDAGGDLPGQWWQIFKSDSLDRTLQAAVADSPTLASAQATLAAAREAVVIARAGYLPRFSATGGAQRSGSALVTSDSYSLGLSASYTFNAFGGATFRLVEQQQALAGLQRYQTAGTYLTLTGGVVNQALTIASTRLQIAITLELLADDQKNLDLTKRMFEVGAAALTDVLTAESQLASDQTSLPALRQQLSISRHALALLAGHAPADWQAPDFELSEFKLPASLPLSLPSALVRQRPDVLAAEAQLHAASAAIGIAVAAEYPSITLSGSLTRDALTAANLFHDFDRVWNIGGALAQPLYAGGALRAQTRAARDTYRAQAADYTEVVITALGQVADNLRALDNDAERVAAYARSLRIATDSLALQRISYAAGRTTVLQLIDAERSYSQAGLGCASAQVQHWTMSRTCSWPSAAGGGIRRLHRPPLENQPSLEQRLALPMAPLMVPVRTALVPTIGHPVVAVALMHVVTGHPDVCATPPFPKSRRPDESGARFGDRLDAYRRRRHVHIDDDTGRCNGRRRDTARGHHQAQQQCLTRRFHSILLTCFDVRSRRSNSMLKRIVCILG